ncbi:hypothetical protein GCM10028807_31710 [Spirosoma daeguense]
MIKRYVITILLISTIALLAVAQPSSTPAPGYVWQAISSSTYTTGPQRTGCKSGPGSCGNGNSSFGLNILCPPDLPTTTLAGCPIIQKQIFGNIGENGSNFSGLTVAQNPGCGGTGAGTNWPQSSTATRRITLTEWANPNPESGVANGATNGTVCLPVAARIIIDDGSICDGSGVGANQLRFLVIGGNSGAQSSFNITANYQLNWSSSKYGGIGSTGNQTINQNLVVFDAGGGNQYDWALQQPNQSWYYPSAGSNVASIGTSLQQTVAVPVGSISQTGGTFTIDFTATAALDLNRAFGNADARVTMGPGFHGRARYEVDYQCWQIVPNSLPVRLVSFIGKVGNGLINLSWETTAEQKNSHFIIERSGDATSFEAIGQETGRGTTSSRQQYVFVDKSPLDGANYYRLRQVDIDGSTAYSKMIAVVYAETQPVLEILGNPTDKQPIRIQLKNLRPDNLRLTSMNGQSVPFDIQSESSNIYQIIPKTANTLGGYILTVHEGAVQLSERIILK